jgi:hypothetical protein
VLTLLAANAAGQVTSGEILGTVRDPTGAVVVDARITARNLETNAIREVLSWPDGRFRFQLLPTGPYQIRVQKDGFAEHEQGPIVLQLNQNAELDIKLQLAGITLKMSVVADAPLINTTNAEIGVNFDPKRVAELPLAPNRNILNLALSVAGVSQLSSGNLAPAQGGVNFSVNGMRLRSNNFLIDGQDSNNSNATGLNQEINNPDTVAEFRLITNQFAPEYGRAAGSVVNIITKRGMNQSHGSAYWFHNGNKLNSRSNLDKKSFRAAPWRIENQFAGTLGGPIVKDKTFFFLSALRWTDHRFASGKTISGAPTAEGQSILRSIAGDRPQVKLLLEHLPPAQVPISDRARVTGSGRTVEIPLGTLSGFAPNNLDDWQWSGRVDHRTSDKLSLGGRYLFDDRADIRGQFVPPGLTEQFLQRRQAVSAFLSSSFSPTSFNELRASYQRFAVQRFAADRKAGTIPSIEINELGLTGFDSSPSRTAIGLPGILPLFQVQNNYHLANTLSVMRGAHSMKFGIELRRQEQYYLLGTNSRGRLLYNTLQNYLDDIAQIATINISPAGDIHHFRYYDYFFFLQDEWRARPNLTLTYGVRYESPGTPVDYFVRINKPILENNNNDLAFAFRPVPKRDTNNWAPRVGFNFRFSEWPGFLRFLSGDGKLVMRGGYSRTYDLLPNIIFQNVAQQFPFTRPIRLAAGSREAFATIDAIRAGSTISPITNPNSFARSIVGEDYRAPVAEQLSFQFQRGLKQDWAFTIGWIGTKGTALLQTVDGNPTLPVNNNRGTLRVDPTQDVIRLRCNCASSIYHSLQTSLEKRLSRNFSMAAHYTWSRFIDDASDIFNASTSGDSAVSQDSFNRRADRGRSVYDRPRRLALNGVVEVPFKLEQKSVVGRLLGGWQISGFLALQSGAPFSPLDGADPGFRLFGIDAAVSNAIRPNLNTTLDLSSMSVEELIRAGGRNLFSRVTSANPIGNAGRNILRADGINNIDFGINKNIKISETQRLQLRAEFYNLFNSRDFGIPEAIVANPGFGVQWNTDGGNRRIVVGLRYTF